MKLLLLTDAFLPAFAPRMGYLCQNLQKKGWDITVITEKSSSEQFNISIQGIKVYAIPYLHSHKFHFLEWSYKTIGNFLWDQKNKNFAKACLKRIGDEPFDAILCSTFYYFPLGAAWKISQIKKLPLYVDLRDMPEQFKGHEYQLHHLKPELLNQKLVTWYEKVQTHRRNQIIQQAKAISTVSPWHQQRIKEWNANVHLIYNGYQAAHFFPKDVATDRFQILYTGKVLSKEMEDPTLLLQATEHLLSQKQWDSKKVEINWYVPQTSKEIITEALVPYPLTTSISHFCNRVPALEVPALLHQCSVALVLSNLPHKDSGHGIMTTKVFEALGVEKPILCVKSDLGYLAEFIQQTQAGKACSTQKEVEDFLLSCYQEWQVNGFTHQKVNQALKASFSRENQAQAFEQMMTLK